jgi:hypothetical protein
MPTPASQIQALEILFHSTQGDQWRWRKEAVSGPKWSFTSPQADPCNDQNRAWQGITCSSPPTVCKLQSCRIISLALNAYNLYGTLPLQFFVQLTSLTALQISLSHDLIGTIPFEIGSLSQLEFLLLSENHLRELFRPRSASCRGWVH